MNPGDPNIQLIEIVAGRLGPLRERLVFVGGCATGLLVTDPARPPARATIDVDVIAEVGSLSKYYELQEELKKSRFKEDPDIVCRWRLGDLRVDVMPSDQRIFGFSNLWYERAIKESQPYHLPSTTLIKLVSPALFIATKLEAFHGRGNADYGASHDIEDIVTVVDGRSELITEISASDEVLRSHIVDEIDTLLGDTAFTSTLSYHLASDAANQARVPEILRRLRNISDT